MPSRAQETPLSGMLAGVGTKFQGHFHHIPLLPNHPLTTDDIGPPISQTMAVIMISPLIKSYKYEKNNEDQEALGYKTLRHKDAVASFRKNKASVTFCICSPCILLCDGL